MNKRLKSCAHTHIQLTKMASNRNKKWEYLMMLVCLTVANTYYLRQFMPPFAMGMAPPMMMMPPPMMPMPPPMMAMPPQMIMMMQNGGAGRPGGSTSTTTTTTTTTQKSIIGFAVPAPVPMPMPFAVPPGVPPAFCQAKPRPLSCPPCPPCVCVSCIPAFYSYCSPCHQKCRCRNPDNAPIPIPPVPPPMFAAPPPQFPPMIAPAPPQVIIYPIPPMGPIIIEKPAKSPENSGRCESDNDKSESKGSDTEKSDSECSGSDSSDVSKYRRNKRRRRKRLRRRKGSLGRTFKAKFRRSSKDHQYNVKPFLTYKDRRGNIKFQNELDDLAAMHLFLNHTNEKNHRLMNKNSDDDFY